MPDQAPSDLILRIVTVPHERFERRGDNLHMQFHISLRDALIGFSRTMQHLDGHLVEIAREGVTRPGQVERIAGEGMPQHNYASQHGDLVIEFVVDFPAALTEEQRDGA